MKKRCFKAFLVEKQHGQALVEFALVLPFLVLLTFGCFQAALFFQHQLTLSASAFMGARAAAVQGPKAEESAKAVILSFAQDSSQKWLSYAQRTAKVDASGELAKVEIGRNEQWFEAVTQMASLVGTKVNKEVPLSQTATLQNEYLSRDAGGGFIASSRTSRIINYDVQLPIKVPSGLLDFSSAISDVPGLDGLAVLVDITKQAAEPNPSVDNGANSSDRYVDADAEKVYFRSGEKMGNSLDNAHAACLAFKGLYETSAASPHGPAIQGIALTAKAITPVLEPTEQVLKGLGSFFQGGSL